MKHLILVCICIFFGMGLSACGGGGGGETNKATTTTPDTPISISGHIYSPSSIQSNRKMSRSASALGLTPQSGVIVSMYYLNSEGIVVGSELASTVSNADGHFSLIVSKEHSPSMKRILIVGSGSNRLRTIVHKASNLLISPVSELCTRRIINANINRYSLDEVNAIMDQLTNDSIFIDLSTAATVEDAIDLLLSSETLKTNLDANLTKFSNDNDSNNQSSSACLAHSDCDDNDDLTRDICVKMSDYVSNTCLNAKVDFESFSITKPLQGTTTAQKSNILVWTFDDNTWEYESSNVYVFYTVDPDADVFDSLNDNVNINASQLRFFSRAGEPWPIYSATGVVSSGVFRWGIAVCPDKPDGHKHCRHSDVYSFSIQNNPPEASTLSVNQENINQISLHWTANEEIDFEKYCLFRSDSGVADLNSEQLGCFTDNDYFSNSYTDNSLDISKSYTYILYTYDNDGDSTPSNFVNAALQLTGDLDRNIIISPERGPYTVGNLKIQDAQLTVQPGVTLNFGDSGSIEINNGGEFNSSLIIKGSPTQPVVLSAQPYNSGTFYGTRRVIYFNFSTHSNNYSVSGFSKLDLDYIAGESIGINDSPDGTYGAQNQVSIQINNSTFNNSCISIRGVDGQYSNNRFSGKISTSGIDNSSLTIYGTIDNNIFKDISIAEQFHMVGDLTRNTFSNVSMVTTVLSLSPFLRLSANTFSDNTFKSFQFSPEADATFVALSISAASITNNSFEDFSSAISLSGQSITNNTFKSIHSSIENEIYASCIGAASIYFDNTKTFIFSNNDFSDINFNKSTSSCTSSSIQIGSSAEPADANINFSQNNFYYITTDHLLKIPTEWSNFKAENNWWGSPSPNPTSFPSNIDYTPAATTLFTTAGVQ